jgi:uncharacterized lipoprotein YmbA
MYSATSISARIVARHFAGLWFIALLLSGCVTVSQKYPEKHHYALDAARQGKQLPSAPGSVLKIRKFRTSPGFEGKEFVYRVGPAHYEQDFYNEWFIWPNAMLTQQTLNWLAGAGLFEYVVDYSVPLPTTHILDGAVTVLYGDYHEAPIKAILGLQFVLVHETAGSTEIIWRHEYRENVEVMEPSPEALVSGWNEALRLILTAVEDDLKQAVVGK